MGTSMASALFTPVQQRVLGLLFGQPGRRFQSAELIRLADAGTGATHRVMQRLAESGLVNVTSQGNHKYYQANPDSPLFEELTSLARKTSGLAEPLREALQPVADRIERAFVYGSIASGEDRADSDIDVMIVSDDLDYPSVIGALEGVEYALGRPINARLMRQTEWREKLKAPNSFVARIAERPQIYLIGKRDRD